MKALVVAALTVGCLLSGCTKTTDGVVAQTTEPVSAAGMTCRDFNTLGERDRAAVVDEILAGEDSEPPPFVAGLAQVICQAIPQADLEDVLLGFSRP
ncbi:MAG: hypothetical protein WBB07_15430 [Mycobacterium sp.]